MRGALGGVQPRAQRTAVRRGDIAMGATAIALALLLGACETTQTQPSDWRSEPSGTPSSAPAPSATPPSPTAPPASKPPSAAPPSTPPARSKPGTSSPPASTTPATPASTASKSAPSTPAGVAAKPECPGGAPLGVLAVISNTVFRNGQPATSGERVCNGDTITTNGSGVGVLLLDGDRGNDTVHIAEGTDPRFTLTQGGCVSVDNYHQGRIVASVSRRCLVVRTPDTLMLLTNATAQLQVTRNISTQVVPLRGSPTKLQSLSVQQVNSYTAERFTQQAAPAASQPQMHSANVYTAYKLVRPPVKLSPLEIKSINSTILKRPLNLPAVPR